jgi:hypothetical protein
MRLKSHVRLRPTLAALVTIGTVTMGLTGYAVSQAGSASADPTVQFVAVGSDTIQDVMNQFSVDLAGNLLGSYNAVNPITGDTDALAYIKGFNATEPATSCTYTRPNGSTDGLNALAESAGITLPTPSPLPTPAPSNCVDIGRSSSSPGGLQADNGLLVYIPFAVDAVTGAVGPQTSGDIQGITGTVDAQATNLTGTGAPDYDFVNYLTTAELTSLYSCPATTGPNDGAVTVTDPLAPSGSVLVNPNVTSTFSLPSGQVEIDLYIPQAGSGTLKFWATELDFNASTPPSCDHQTIVNAAAVDSSYDGEMVEEHNGTAIAVDPDGYFPFSIAQWISQSKHTTGDAIDLDRRYGAQLQEVNGDVPIESNGELNTNFPFVREVYNIVQYAEVETGSSTYNQALASMFVGTTSSLCQDLPTIVDYGFAPLPSTNPNLPDQCGSIASTLRAVAP